MTEKYRLPHKHIREKSRIKIAYITRGISGLGGIGTDTSKLIWDGISSAVKEEDIDLYTFVGGHDKTAVNNYIYELLSDNLVDGIISWASSKVDEATELLAQYTKTPIISLSVDLKEHPVVTIDNTSGMKSIITHLIQRHNLSRIAFVQGPVNHVYAKERLNAYRETLKEFNIPLNENLISTPYEWNKETGYRAVELFIDTRGLKVGEDIEAIVCVNDRIAIGVIETLKNRGYKCPDNIIVTGFNNLDEAKKYNPSISTVAMPFYEQGRHAVHLIKELNQSGEIPRINKLTSISVIHESCGCPNMWIHSNHNSSQINRSVNDVITYIREHINELKGEDNYLEYLYTREDFSYLLECFLLSLTESKPNNILDGIRTILKKSSSSSIDLYQWQTLFSFYREIIYSVTKNTEVLLLSEHILGRSIGLIMDQHLKSGSDRELKAIINAENLKKIDKGLSETLDLESVKQTLIDILPQTEIKSFYLILFDRNYDNTLSIPDESLLYMGYRNQKVLDIHKDGVKFLTSDILPKGFLESTDRKDFLLQALPFGETKLGYLVFEMGPEEGGIYGSIAQKLSDSINSSYLAQDLKEQTQKLKRSNNKLIEQQYILDTFIESLPDLIHFKDRDGKITKSNTAFLQKMGYEYQEEVIGIPSVDLFPIDQRKNIKNYEKVIINSREKSLNTNEKIIFGETTEWYMTTRMPLFNYLGEISGMFEISRDITQLKEVNDDLAKSLKELKEAQKQLVEAEKMIALGELVMGVAHEINTPLGICITASSYLNIQLNDFFGNNNLFNSESQNIVDTLNLITNNLERVSKLVKDFKQISTQTSISDLTYIELYDYLTYQIISFKQNLPRETDITIKCDPELKLLSYPDILDIIISHLLNNSTEHGYLQDETIKISIEVYRDHDSIIILYRDYGKGLDKNALNKIFNPFFTTKRGLGSTGLGMHIVYNLINRTLKGQISCNSNEGDGVTFIITLPQPLD